MDEEQLIDAIERMGQDSPDALLLVMMFAGNEMRGAVDEGRVDIQLLEIAANHLRMLVESGPLISRQ